MSAAAGFVYQDYFAELSGGEVAGLAAFILLVSGAVFCFTGYRIFKIALGVLGFFLGALLAGTIAQTFFGAGETAVIIAGAIGGAAGAVLMVVFFFAGLFFTGATLGVVLTLMISQTLSVSFQPFVLLLSAVVGGVAGILAQRVIIVIATSLAGSWGILLGIYYFLAGSFVRPGWLRNFAGAKSISKESLALMFCWVLMGLAGVFVQYKFTGKNVKPGKGEE